MRLPQAAPKNFVVQLDLAKILLMPLDLGPGQLDPTHLQVLTTSLSNSFVVIAVPELSYQNLVPPTTYPGGCAGARECNRATHHHQRATRGSHLLPRPRAGSRFQLAARSNSSVLTRPQVAIAAQHISRKGTTQRQVECFHMSVTITDALTVSYLQVRLALRPAHDTLSKLLGVEVAEEQARSPSELEAQYLLGVVASAQGDVEEGRRR